MAVIFEDAVGLPGPVSPGVVVCEGGVESRQTGGGHEHVRQVEGLLVRPRGVALDAQVRQYKDRLVA